MEFPPPGDLNEYDRTILKKIDSTKTSLEVDYRVTEIYGDEDNPCSLNVRDKLTSLTFQENSQLVKIRDYAFFNCTKLKTIDLTVCTELTDICKYAFCQCSSLSSVKFPTTKLKRIDEHAFKSCGLIDVFIPKCVTLVAYGSLLSCWQMKTLAFESDSGVNTLYKYLLTGSKVESFCIPKNVRTINSGVFESAGSLKTLTVEAGSTYFAVVNQGLMNFHQTLFHVLPIGITGTYSVPNSTQEICTLAFCGSKAETVILPDSLVTIQGYSFAWASQLKELVIPDSVSTIGDYAFRDCSKLQTVKLSCKCSKIGEYSFNGCNLSKIIVPEGVKTLGAYCFSNNPNLKEVVLPSTIEEIGGNVFPNNKGINITFGANSSIKASSDMIIMDNDETMIIQYMGSETGFSPTIEKTIKIIKAGAFVSKQNLVGFSFPGDSELTTIESKAFQNCKNLQTITFPASLVSIGEYAFQGCSGLTKVIFKSINNLEAAKSIDFNHRSFASSNANFTTLGKYCFAECTKIEEIDLQSTNAGIIDEYSFQYCTGLKTVKLPATTIDFKTSCFYNCYSLATLSIPNESSIREINDYAFYSTSITSFSFTRNSLTKVVERYAFGNCTKLATFDFCDTLTEIEAYAFTASGITSVNLSSRIERIRDRCFYGCSSLEIFKIPTNSCLTEEGLEAGAFGNCRSFSIIICESRNFVFSSQSQALFSADQTRLILYPSASKTLYLPIPEKVKKIGNGAFIGCTNLISVFFYHNSIQSIGNNAFEDCKHLHYINIPKSITVVGENAFSGCKSLTCGVDIESNDSTFIHNLVYKSKLPARALRNCSSLSCKNNKSRSGGVSALTYVFLAVISQ